MALDRLVSLILRSAELVFAAIVAGVTGDYLHKSHASAWDQGRFIYTVVVAGISIFLALIWLFPFSSTFTHSPVDIFISILWWVAFGLLANVSILLSPLHEWLANICSCWDLPAVLGSTGTTSRPGATSAADSKPTLPFRSFLPSSGSRLPLLASFGCESRNAVLAPRRLLTDAVGIAAATSRGSNSSDARYAREAIWSTGQRLPIYHSPGRNRLDKCKAMS